jgi:serpin B
LGKIEDLLPDGSVQPETRAVLTNALYLEAPWRVPFEADRNVEADFERLDGSRVTVELMRQLERHAYAEGDGWAAVELDYRSSELSMVLIVPDTGRFEAFGAALTSTVVEDALAALVPANVLVLLPKFELETQLRLRATLQTLGLVRAFGADADFSGMVQTGELHLDEAYHRTYVGVGERGTVAAAATAVVGNGNGSTPDHTLRIDRPFYFLIRDRPTGVWLFFGRVVDPSA